MNLNVQSEVDRLNGVIVHTPGDEVALVSPDIKDELLFDDIVFDQAARLEHQGMLDVFRAAMPEEGVVFEITDLILTAFKKKKAREFFIGEIIKCLPEENLAAIEKDLAKLSAKELYAFAVYGRSSKISGFQILPSPNILFTRDLAAVLGNHIVVSKAAKKARIRESILMDCLVQFHPLFKSVRRNAIRLSAGDSVEGGDILIPSKDLVLIGMSERTSFSGVMRVSERILASGVKTVLVVDIPKQRSSMHLDTIFTFCSDSECLIFPQAITERSNNIVALYSKNGKMFSEMKGNLHAALEDYLKREITFIECGGSGKINQLREQWTDGANVFALAPGIVVGYERNTHTFLKLERSGYTLMNQYDFIKAAHERAVPLDGSMKIAISFEGHELCRGRGGARCMTMPISRIARA